MGQKKGNKRPTAFLPEAGTEYETPEHSRMRVFRYQWLAAWCWDSGWNKAWPCPHRAPSQLSGHAGHPTSKYLFLYQVRGL